MRPKELEELTGIQAEAWELQQNYCQDVPQPQEMMHLYHPMKFKKLRGKEHVIKRLKMECADVSSFRHSLLFGVKKFSVRYDKPMTFHELIGPRGSNGEDEDIEKFASKQLIEAKGLLTSDKPIEVYSQYIAFHKMRGHVLVGGLGLGMAAEMILRLPKVKSVTVVEVNESLIDLIEPQIDWDVEVLNADLFEFLKEPAEEHVKYDSAYFDIWYGTGESAWQSTVVPLYRAARKIGINNLGAWGEHEMRGQLISALYGRTRMEEKYSTWKPYKVFIKGAKKIFGSAPPWNGEYKDDVVALIKLYIEQVGSPKWEETFDWEAA